MSSKNDRYVVKHPDGWAVKKSLKERAIEVFATQHQAEIRAKEIVSSLGEGEVIVQGSNGRWRDSDTVSPASDPNPPLDRKH